MEAALFMEEKMYSNTNHYKIESHADHRYITFPVLTDLGIKHCFTTSDILKKSDDPYILKKAYFEAFDFIDGCEHPHIFTSQVHSDNIEVISSCLDGETFHSGQFYEDTDGLITNLKNTVLVTKFADCTPVVIVDPVNKVIANLHSGWRGTSKKIFLKALQIMSEKYCCIPENLIAIIGPCIGYEDFEIQKDVLDIFTDSFGNIDDYYTKKDPLHYLLDMQGVIKRSLVSDGLKESNIYSTDISTFSSELMHSYRRAGANAGRMIMAIYI